MSEGDVSLIRDEDVLRRMWQQTEDFSRKKEIRAHMYRLREERLRNLYSPEPGAEAKGCEFTSSQGHVKSFADQTFQSMKSKEVRDAGSPPKEFTYHGQDLKELSNAGWNVESENKTTDDGHTRVKSVHANIEGRYDVDGGHGQFAAVDHNKQAVTEYDDGNTSLKRNENVSNTAAHEQVLRKTDDGTHFSSTKSSSTSSSKFEQISSKRETVPYETTDDFDLSSHKTYDHSQYDTNRNEEITSNKFTKTSEYEQKLRNDYDHGELVSRKIDYPDENTKVIIETRCLPDGTRVTSTRREFRAPAVQTSHSEEHSHQSKSESKSSSHTSSQKRSHVNESSSKVFRETTGHSHNNIVDSQKTIDDYDFQKDYSINRNDDYKNDVNNQPKNQRTYKTNDDKSIPREVIASRNNDSLPRQDVETTHSQKDIKQHTQYTINKSQGLKNTDDQTHYTKKLESVKDIENNLYNINNKVESSKVEDQRNNTVIRNHSVKDNEERNHNIINENVVVERKTSTEQHQSTYQNDVTQKKISNDWSPAHQAWASTLRSDTPTKPSTRASSPGSKTFKSSASSLRSSVSPDKINRKPSSRGGSPNKIDRTSPTRTVSEKYSSTHSATSITEKRNKIDSPDRKSPDTYRSRSSKSPEKPRPPINRFSSSPDKQRKNSKSDDYVRSKSPIKPDEKSTSPQRSPLSNDKHPANKISTPSINDDKLHPNEDFSPKYDGHTYSPNDANPPEDLQRRRSLSPDRKTKHQKPSSPIKSPTEPIQRQPKEPSPTRATPQNTSDNQPGYMKPTASSKPKSIDDKSADHKMVIESTVNRIKEDHYKFIDEETKMYVKDNRQTTQTKHGISSDKKTPDLSDISRLLKDRSPSPEKHFRKSPSRNSPNKDYPNNDRSPKEYKDSPRSQESPSRIINSKTQTPDSPSDTPPMPKVSRLQSKSPSPMRKRPSDYEPISYSDMRTLKNKSPSPDKSFINKDTPSANTIIATKEIKNISDLNDKQEPITPNNTDSIPKQKRTSPFKPATRDTAPEDKILAKDDVSPERNVSQPNRTSLRSRTPSPVKNISLATKVQSVDTNKHFTSKKNEASNVHTKDLFGQNRVTVIVDEDSQKPMTQNRETSKNKPTRSSNSPAKFSQASDFIEVEKSSEEFNKNTLKERPRQLITPSTSPTRKPKTAEVVPLSGQSSPTTSVSGFEYFSSRPDETVVTDLDEQVHSDNTNEYNTYEMLRNITAPLSVPCRSPSPEKRPTKENLPRKSSLKKPSNNQMSPTEKPPSSFVVSPNVETKEFVDYKVVIQDHPDKDDKPVKTKPPFERRETYEERCRKILGMVETDTNEAEDITKDITSRDTDKSLSNVSSPSVSPCRSPSFEKESSVIDNIKKTDKIINDKFISHQTEDERKTKISLNNISDIRKTSKIPTRESSPTKLQDITLISEDESVKSKISKESIEKETSVKSSTESNYIRSNISPRKPTDKETKSHISKQVDEIDNWIETSEKPKPAAGNLIEPKSKNQPFKRVDSPERILKDSIHTKKETKPKMAVVSSEIQIQHTTESLIEDNIIGIVNEEEHFARSKSPISPERKLPAKISSPIKHVSKPNIHNTNVTSNFNTDFISSEKEKEVLDRVQKSLRKLSPDRKDISSTYEKKPQDETTPTNFQGIKIVSSDNTTDIITTNDTNVVHRSTTNITNDDNRYTEKQKCDKEKKVSSKPPSRNVSPTKKPSNVSPVPARSISPKKPLSPTERPQSPLMPKPSGIKPREQVSSHIRKPSPSTLSSTKVEKSVTDIKKGTTTTSKHLNSTKTITNKFSTAKTVPFNIQTTTNKASDQEQKRVVTPKTPKDSAKKDIDAKVSRTVSDLTPKLKKTSPQRMKSKPEIQVQDVTTGKVLKQTTLSVHKTQKLMCKEPQLKLPTSKPKSATALNTSTDDDDVIIDVQQAKSSRENSPDRICPTPVGFSEDIGTPRFPDEVNEPDDEYQRRTYHTIHEAESIVDDIVEISEDDELFVKRSDTDEVIEKGVFSVDDKVTKITKKIENVSKSKDTTARFRDTERQVHSDFLDNNLKSDDCLLSVSEKVNKFAKGTVHTKDNKSPSRNIVEEYDKHTTYQDDYTKLSVNDKAHLFIETAENFKTTKTKPLQKVERPDFTDVDDTLKSDDCLLSVSDKVNKFVKTAEQFLNESHEIEEKEKKIKEQHDIIMKKIVENIDDNVLKTQNKDYLIETTEVTSTSSDVDDRRSSFVKENAAFNAKVKNQSSPNVKPAEKSTVKITTLRSSDAVKKAKALFENIASTTATTHKIIDTSSTKSTTPMDKAVTKKVPKIDSSTIPQCSPENISETNKRTEIIQPHTTKTAKIGPLNETTVGLKEPFTNNEERPRASPARLRPRSSERVRSKSPTRLITETISTHVYSSTELPKSGEPTSERLEKQQAKVPGYQRPTKTSQIKDESKVVDDTETVSSRRGSGKFGVELRRMSNERSTPSNERRRSSVEHHQPCIEDIFDLDLLEQMLEKVVGYEQRRRIRAQIRIAKKRIEKEQVDTHTSIKTKHIVTKTNKPRSPDRYPKSPERLTKTASHKNESPDRQIKDIPHKTSSPERNVKSTPQILLPSKPSAPMELNKPLANGHSKEPQTNFNDKLVRPHSPAKLSTKVSSKTKSPVRQQSPEKKSRPLSPSKAPVTKPKSNRFSEYASAYMKKVGLKESDKITDTKAKKSNVEEQKTRRTESHHTVETKISSTKKISEQANLKDKIEITDVNGKRSPSPEIMQNNRQHEQEKRSPERQSSPNRKTHSPEIIPGSPERRQSTPVRSPTPEVARQKSDVTKTKKETIIKTMYDIEKKIPHTPKQEEKPSWITNRNLKKTSEMRTFTTKKVEPEKTRYRTVSPSKVISKPIDVITSSYGPGPLDADGRPLFGIKALRNGGSNYQVKGTVIRQEFHSRNGGEPEGTVSVTAYSTEPEDLDKLLQSQGEKPSRIHGLAAITTTKKFGGETGTTFSEVHNKEERAVLDQFTHSDRKVTESRITTSNLDSADEFIQKEKLDSENDRYAQRDRIEVIDAEEFEKRGSKYNKAEKESVNKLSSKMQTEKEKKEMERRGREKIEKNEKREEKKTVRQSSVKSLTEKYIKSASETAKSERHVYPKAGLILRTSTMKDSMSSDSSAHAGLTRTDSEHSLGSDEEVTTTTTTEQIGDGVKTTTTTTTRSGYTRGTERSFLDSSTKVTGVQDILTRMKNADIVIEEGDSSADSEARALLNKFLGATVLMAGMQNYVTEKPTGKVVIKQETVQSSGGKVSGSRRLEEFDIEQCWDERVLRQLLDECTDYEQRRRLRARIRTLMAEQEACASAVTEALAAAGETVDTEEQSGEREEEEVTTITSSVRRNSSEKTVSSSTTTIKNSKVIESMTRPAPKPVSPFAKFRQLEKQNSTNSPNSPKSPQSPGSPSQPYFKFTDPALQASAVTIKERLLHWCRDKTREYENVKLENFSTSWADGLAFCALVHHFLPNTFDYSKLTPEKRRHNFTLAFKVADEKAGIYPLLDVDDMVAMRKPDWKCVFTYVQSIYRRFKDEQ